MILVCGEALVDFVVRASGPDAITTEAVLGGSPFNTAIALSRLGASVGFHGGVSRDRFGDLIQAKLVSHGVDVGRVVRSDRLSTISVVTTDADGVASYAFHGEGKADRFLEPGDASLDLPDDVEAITFGSYTIAVPPVCDTLLALAKREGHRRTISIDPNLRPTVTPDRADWRRRFEAFLPHAAIVKASEEDISGGYGAGVDIADIARRWSEAGPALVLVTHGPRGATGYLRGEPPLAVFGQPVDVVDTIGAGDTFHAAILAGLSRAGCLARDRLPALTQSTLERAMTEAVVASVITCTRAGANPPSRRDLEQALAARG